MKTRSIPRTGRLLGPLAALAILALPIPALAQLDTPLIDTRSASSATNIDSEVLRNVPSARDPWSVLRAAPGVAPGQEVSVSGASSLMTIDGITVGNPADLGSSQSYIDFDAIQEVQVQTGGAGAEYGRDAIGGVIQIVTKDETKEWNGSGQVLGGSGDASGQAFANGRFEVMVQEEADGGYCMERFQLLNDGTPVQPDGPLSIGFDQGFSIGADPSSQTPFSAGKRFTIEPCPGAETGMSFVDSPTPVTPPTPTHLYFGRNGVFAVDMNRVAALYGVQDPSSLERSFFLNGERLFTYGGFQQLPGAGVQQAAGSGNGLYLYGIDLGSAPFEGAGTSTG